MSRLPALWMSRPGGSGTALIHLTDTQYSTLVRSASNNFFTFRKPVTRRDNALRGASFVALSSRRIASPPIPGERCPMHGMRSSP